jgi:hypothetical protein
LSAPRDPTNAGGGGVFVCGAGRTHRQSRATRLICQRRPDLQSAIAGFLEVWNENPKLFVWTTTIESIQAKLARCRQTLQQIKPGCTAP